VTLGDRTVTRLADEDLSLPCGVFAGAMRLRLKDARYATEVWFGRGVGLLKTSCAETGVVEVLTAYKVAKD
jgi:hypothetical protein